MRKDAPGFTLVELMIALAVLALLLGLALPGFGPLIERQRTATAMHLVSAQFAQARNTAVMRRTPVTVCPSRGDGLCRNDADWSQGWLMYRDPRSGSQPRSPADVLGEQYRPAHGPVRILSSAGRPRIRFQPDGRSGGTNLTIRICIAGSVRGEVVVNNVGRVRNIHPQRLIPCA